MAGPAQERPCLCFRTKSKGYYAFPNHSFYGLSQYKVAAQVIRLLIRLSCSFLIWQLRTSYLTNIKDGIGERLINVDSSVLNDPSFRAAGWTADIAEIKRTYSPPIPTAITSDYFSAPPRSAGFAPAGFNDEDDEGGMISKRGSTETVAPGPNVRRRRHREQQEEDDSSDLSDESDGDTEGTHR